MLTGPEFVRPLNDGDCFDSMLHDDEHYESDAEQHIGGEMNIYLATSDVCLSC